MKAMKPVRNPVKTRLITSYLSYNKAPFILSQTKVSQNTIFSSPTFYISGFEHWQSKILVSFFFLFCDCTTFHGKYRYWMSTLMACAKKRKKGIVARDHNGSTFQ